MLGSKKKTDLHEHVKSLTEELEDIKQEDEDETSKLLDAMTKSLNHISDRRKKDKK